MEIAILTLISFITGTVMGAALVRYGIGVGAKSAAGELPSAQRGKPTEQATTGGIDEMENYGL